jgi:hypothetical protein
MCRAKTTTRLVPLRPDARTEMSRLDTTLRMQDVLLQRSLTDIRFTVVVHEASACLLQG